MGIVVGHGGGRATLSPSGLTIFRTIFLVCLAFGLFESIAAWPSVTGNNGRDAAIDFKAAGEDEEEGGGTGSAPVENLKRPGYDPTGQIYNASVFWTGGKSHTSCDTCLQSNTNITFLAPDYACNMERRPSDPGQWNNGTKSFFLDIDPSRIVTQVNLTMHGRFRCRMRGESQQPTIMNIQVEGVSTTQAPVEFSQCLDCDYCSSCDACMTNVTVVGFVFEPEWPTAWNYFGNNTISIQVLSGFVCLYSVDIYVMTYLANIPITATITTSNPNTTGTANGREFEMPVWGYALIASSGFLCCISIASWMAFVALKRIRKRGRRYSSIQDYDEELKGGFCGCLDPIVDTETEDDMAYSRDPSVYTTIDVNEVGEDTKRLLGIPVNAEMGSAERKALLKISHRGNQRSSGRDDAYKRTHRRRKSRDGMVKQMDYGEIVLGERIGKGSYGEVFKGTWRGTEVAVKKLPYYFEQLEDREQQKNFMEGFVQETQLMKTLRHPNVIQLFASFTHPEVMIVMEYMARGSLYQILHDKSIELSWDLRRQILLDAARGMTYLHKSQPVIVHRDLKSHNLLVGEHWRCKVSDFGLSRMLTAMDTMTSCGTPSWTAPEVLRGEKYTEKCDVYSFGIVLWECVTRATPHEGIPHFQVVFQVGTQGLRPDIPSDTPHAWARLITDCWAEDQDARPSFEEILERLQML